MYEYACVHVCMYECMCACLYVCMGCFVCMHVHMDSCMFVCKSRAKGLNVIYCFTVLFAGNADRVCKSV